MSVILSPCQARALEEIEAWIGTGSKRKTLGGYAGTGKTTLIRELMRRHYASVCAFTGKAAFVLRSKGVEQASTMHALMYEPVKECVNCRCLSDDCLCIKPNLKTGFRKVFGLPHSLVIVDEASMVDARLMADLESFRTQVLYVGDHGQLEPLGDDPGLMRNPDIRLEEIHRQAAGSPVIKFAHHVRLGHKPQSFGDDARIILADSLSSSLVDLKTYDAVICGYNATRVRINARMRELLGFSGRIPKVGERVICLRNHKNYGIFNGMQGVVTSIRSTVDSVILSVRDDLGNDYTDMVAEPKQFGSERTLSDTDYGIALFDFGYCITAHKSQGSEWDNVLVVEQISSSWSKERWRYTAVTRAAKSVTYLMRPPREEKR